MDDLQAKPPDTPLLLTTGLPGASHAPPQAEALPTKPRKRRVYTRHNDKRMKQEFARNVIKAGGNRTKGFEMTFPGVSHNTAIRAGWKLFKDPMVQEEYVKAGVDVPFLARRSRELMESQNESVAAGVVKEFVRPLLNNENVQRVERVSVSLFGELTDGEMQLIRIGKKLPDGRGRGERRPADPA